MLLRDNRPLLGARGYREQLLGLRRGICDVLRPGMVAFVLSMVEHGLNIRMLSCYPCLPYSRSLSRRPNSVTPIVGRCFTSLTFL